jgi:hypothetical protein
VKTETAKNKIHKPEKVLNATLANQKAKLEEDGWKFSHDEKLGWEGKRDGSAIGHYEKLADLLGEIEGLQQIVETYAPKIITEENRLPDNTEISFEQNGKKYEGYIFDVTFDKTQYLIKAEVGGIVSNFYLKPGEFQVKNSQVENPVAAEAEAGEKPKFSDRTLAVLAALKLAPDAEKIDARPWTAHHAYEGTKLPKDEKKRTAKLKKDLADYESNLENDIRCYNEIRNRTAEQIENEHSTDQAAGAIMLKLSHISYDKWRINAALGLLGEPLRYKASEFPQFWQHNLTWEFAPEEIADLTPDADLQQAGNSAEELAENQMEYGWTFTPEQIKAIKYLSSIDEIVGIFKTNGGAAEIEYKTKKGLSRRFVLPKGNVENQHSEEIGKTIAASILTLDIFFDLFSAEATEAIAGFGDEKTTDADYDGDGENEPEKVYVSPEMYEFCQRNVNVYAFTRETTSGRKKQPMASEIIFINEKTFVATGQVFTGDSRNFVIAYEVVRADKYDGDTTTPEEWEKRGVGNFKGIRILGMDDFYVTLTGEQIWIGVKNSSVETDESDGDGKTEPAEAKPLSLEQTAKVSDWMEKGWKIVKGANDVWKADKQFDEKPVSVTDKDLEEVFRLMEQFEPKPEPVKVKPSETLPETEIKKVRFTLTDEDVKLKTNALMDTLSVIDTKKAALADIKKEYKKAIDDLDKEQGELRDQIRSRVEYRPVECLIEYDLARGEAVYYRPDTQEQVDRRSMTKDELRIALANQNQAQLKHGQKDLF